MAKKSSPEGLTALVTGGAGGIGLEFAKVLFTQGASVILIDLDEKKLKEAKEIIEVIREKTASDSPRVYTLTLDLTSADITERIDAFNTTNSLTPEILINNAGIFSFKPITDTDEKKIEAFINLHVRAVTLLSRWFASKRKKEGKGWVLNMSSMSCWMPMPGLAMYSSTKSYIRVFSRALHYEMKEYGVGITVACPGGIATDLFGLPKNLQKLAVSLGVLQTPDKFAAKAVKKMMKQRKQYINGWINRLSIFFVGILPTRIRMIVKHRMLDKGISR